jgi:hypothetical protein
MHFDPLGGPPQRNPIGLGDLQADRRARELLVGTNWNVLDFPSGSAAWKMLGYSTLIYSVVAP